MSRAHFEAVNKCRKGEGTYRDRRLPAVGRNSKTSGVELVYVEVRGKYLNLPIVESLLLHSRYTVFELYGGVNLSSQWGKPLL